MDIEAQILKHLPRDARESISFIDRYYREVPFSIHRGN
jgi:hypothetical protein